MFSILYHYIPSRSLFLMISQDKPSQGWIGHIRKTSHDQFKTSPNPNGYNLGLLSLCQIPNSSPSENQFPGRLLKKVGWSVGKRASVSHNLRSSQRREVESRDSGDLAVWMVSAGDSWCQCRSGLLKPTRKIKHHTVIRWLEFGHQNELGNQIIEFLGNHKWWYFTNLQWGLEGIVIPNNYHSNEVAISSP